MTNSNLLKAVTLLIPVILSVLSCHKSGLSKIIKTGRIDYKGGTVTYEYYKDPKTSKCIKNGTFKFIKNQKAIHGGCVSVVITGQFNDNYRDSLWSFSIYRKDLLNIAGAYTSSCLNATQTYKNGWPDGKWLINETSKWRELHDNKNTLSCWGPYFNKYNHQYSIYFKNGILTGFTSSFSNNPTDTLTDTLTDTNINLNGLTSRCYLKPPIKGTISEKFLCSPEGEIAPDDYLSEIKTKANKDSVYIYIKKYLNGEIPSEKLNKLHIRVADEPNHLTEIRDHVLDDEYFYLSGIDGDKSIESGKEHRIYGRYVDYWVTPIIPFLKNPYFTQFGNSKLSLECEINSYQQFIDKHSSECSESDLDSINILLNNEKEKFKIWNTEHETQKQYLELYYELGNRPKFPSKHCKTENSIPYFSAIHDFSINMKNLISDCSDKITSLIPPSKYKNEDFSREGYRENRGNYSKSLEIIKEFIDYKKNIKSKYDSIATISTMAADIVFNINDIECRYIKNQTSFLNIYDESNPKKTRKTYLYNAYINILNYSIAQINKSKSFPQCYEYLQDLNDICWFVVNALKTNTDTIKIQLKKTKDPNIQLSILMKQFHNK